MCPNEDELVNGAGCAGVPPRPRLSAPGRVGWSMLPTGYITRYRQARTPLALAWTRTGVDSPVLRTEIDAS